MINNGEENNENINKEKIKKEVNINQEKIKKD